MTLPFRIHRRAAPVALAVAAVLGAQAAQAATWVYVANADSQDVSVLELDRAAGTLKPVDPRQWAAPPCPWLSARTSACSM